MYWAYHKGNFTRMFKFKKSFFFLYLITTALLINAQADKADSLRLVIKSNPEKSEKIKAYKELAQAMLFKNFDECQAASAAGARLAVKLNDQASLSEFKKLTGLSWYFKGTYDSAAVYYYNALDILKKSDAPLVKAAVLNELGKLYRKTKDLDRSLQMYDEAFAIYKKLNDENNIATILNESGVVFEYKKDYTEAIKRYKSSLAIREKLNDAAGKAYSLNFLGGVYTLQKNFVEAENYLLQSLDLRKQLKDSFAIALNYSDLGYMFKEQGNYDKATEQYNLSNALAVKMQYAELLQSNYSELAAIAEKAGNFALSLDYYKKQTALKDSIYSGDKMKQIEQLNAKYQTEKKEQQLKLQEAEITKKNYLLWGLLASIAVLILSGIGVYRKRQLLNKITLQAAVMKQQDIATKAIINAEENERKRIAAELHDGVGQMMSAAKMNLSAIENEMFFKDEAQKNSFNKVIGMLDESCKEVRSVSHQMMPNALLKSGLASAVKEFLDKIDNRIIKITLHTEGLQERLESNTETVLYRVIQECVNNVIKHSGANNLDIALIKDADGISATVEDNGCGFNTSDKQKFEGIGLKNINSRVNFLKGTVDFDSSPGRGTLVAIHIPIAQ
jgi:two-component system, NarL family, sensor kinase